MAVNKLDPKIIFASEAPVQDTPAVFNNRTAGWGESRKNGGRPTIKQMNALQQDTELKILWLNENAVTPFDATIDYPTNAVTIKDGVFKIFNGTSWNLFLDKYSVGLSNVDNTSDLNKPISASTQDALDLKTDDANFIAHTGDTNNPHQVTKTQVGLSNVDNTSDLNKPISTAVKTKLDYIDNNGASLPYIEGVAYEENAVVVKDGLIQQKSGTSWVIPFMRSSQNLAELSDVAQARTNLNVYSKSETDAIVGTPYATETVAGKAKIATTAIAQAGTDDTYFLTAKKLRDALNASGNAPVSACRAWVLYDSTVTPLVIRASFNIASVTYLGGNSESLITFINEMPSANFVAVGSCGSGENSVDGTSVNTNFGAPPTTKTCRVGLKDAGGGGNRRYVSVAFFA